MRLLTLEILSNQVTANKTKVWITIVLLLSVALRSINTRSILVTTFTGEFQDDHFIAQQQNQASALILNLFFPSCQMNVACYVVKMKQKH